MTDTPGYWTPEEAERMEAICAAEPTETLRAFVEVGAFAQRELDRRAQEAAIIADADNQLLADKKDRVTRETTAWWGESRPPEV